MAIGKMLAVLALLAVICPGYSMHLSAWGQKDVLDNDVSLFTIDETEHDDVDNVEDLHEIKPVDGNDIKFDGSDDIDNLHDVKPLDSNDINFDNPDNIDFGVLDNTQLDDSDNNQINELHDIKRDESIDTDDLDNINDPDDIDDIDLDVSDDIQLDLLDDTHHNVLHDIKLDDSDDIDDTDDDDDSDDTQPDLLDNTHDNVLHDIKFDHSDDIDDTDDDDDSHEIIPRQTPPSVGANYFNLHHSDDTQLNDLNIKLDDTDNNNDSDDVDGLHEIVPRPPPPPVEAPYDINLYDFDNAQLDTGDTQPDDLHLDDSEDIQLNDLSNIEFVDSSQTQLDDLHDIKYHDLENTQLNDLDDIELDDSENIQLDDSKNIKFDDSDNVVPDYSHDTMLDSHDVKMSDTVYTPLENANSINLFESNESPFDDSNNNKIDDTWEINVLDSGKIPLSDYYLYNTSDDNTIKTQLDDSHNTRRNHLDNAQLDDSQNFKFDDLIEAPLEDGNNIKLHDSDRLMLDDSNDIPDDNSFEINVLDSGKIPLSDYYLYNTSDDNTIKTQLDDSHNTRRNHLDNAQLDDSQNFKSDDLIEAPLEDGNNIKLHDSDRLMLDDSNDIPDDDSNDIPDNDSNDIQLDANTHLDDSNDINVHYSSNNDVNVNNYKICNEPECRQFANMFLNSINKSVNPCDDFYEFACGSWSKTNLIRHGHVSWNHFKSMRYSVEIALGINLLGKSHPNDIIPVKQAKRWFASCMNSDNREKRGVKPIASILMQAGNWPILMENDEWDAEKYSWQKVERIYTRLTGKPTLYNIQSTSSFSGLNIVSPDVPIDYMKLKIWSYNGKNYYAYIRAIESTVNLFMKNDGVTREKIRKEIKEIVDFEKEIYKLKQKKPAYRKMTFDKFIEFYDTNVTAGNAQPQTKFEWKSMMEELSDMLNIKINTSTAIFGYDNAYITGINNLLKRTPARTIANYIHWNFVAKTIQYTDRFSTRALFELNQLLYGPIDRVLRLTECMNELPLPHAAYLLINKRFFNTSEQIIREMINNIRIGLKDQIDNSNWLSAKARKWAKDKVDKIKLFVGGVDWYTNETAITQMYKGLIVGNDHFDNSLSSIRFSALQELKALVYHDGQSLKRRFESDPFDVNYATGYNTLFAPTIVIPTDFSIPEFPSNVKYGIASNILGHHIGRAFDTKGIKYGSYRNSARLPDSILRKYKKRAQCFVNQYTGYFSGYFKQNESMSEEFPVSLSPMKISVQMKDENIADWIGLQATFKAYKELSKKFSNGDRKLPGLEEFTDDQLFFLSYANMGCEAYTPQSQRKIIEALSTHSPGRFKVIGAVSNTKEFAEAFNCPIGSPMNPIKKCSIWKKPETPTEQNYRRWLAQLMR